MLTGAARFGAEAWPTSIRAERESENAHWNAAIRDPLWRLGEQSGCGRTALLLIVADLPLAAVRRYLAAGTAVPDDLAEVTATLVRDALH
ncbi:hypothetical protein [Nocardia sp. NPDC023988]|uniref:hypothetical protein n=1 Tax=unclassified Nocardia TaxID=2637762 RepID=UPI0033D83C20